MKIIITSLLLILTINSIVAQKIKVPEKAQETFQLNYPEEKPKWELDSGYYKAVFKFQGTKSFLLFDSTGKFIKSEIGRNIGNGIPDEVVAYLGKNYPGTELIGMWVTEDEAGILRLKIEIKKYYLIFDHDGSFLKKEVIPKAHSKK